MNKDNKLSVIGISLFVAALFVVNGCKDELTRKPNYIIIFTDDQGYNDIGCFGGTHVSTPNIDQLASEGIKLTSFYVAGSICTPSRAALMTGSYPKRVGLARGSEFGVLFPNDEIGMHPNEITIAEILKSQGYVTGIFGKWHLGDHPHLMPTQQGFDEFYGIPYSHDMHPCHPSQEQYQFPPLPLYKGEKIIEKDPDADYLTKNITVRAVEFINRNKDSPFFLYIPHPIPHRPLHASPPFMDDVSEEIKNILSEENNFVDYLTRDNLLKQAIAEIDWSIKEIIDALKKNGIDENTLVILTSDNGPAVGSANPLRGKKGTPYEGGMRVPAIAWWPGKIPAGIESDEILTAMDLLPTFAELAGTKPPQDRIIDGRNIWSVLSTQRDISPHERFFYYQGDVLRAVRSGKWKLHRTRGSGFELYNLQNDISEESNLANRYPEIVKRLESYMIDFDIEMNDSSKVRPHGTVDMFDLIR